MSREEEGFLRFSPEDTENVREKSRLFFNSHIVSEERGSDMINDVIQTFVYTAQIERALFDTNSYW